MEKLKMHSPDLTQDNIAKIRELFPGCVTEAADEDGAVSLVVNFDQMRQELSGQIVDGPQERYQLNWPGKREAIRASSSSIVKTLRPNKEESVDFSSTKNIFVEGDNLEVLKLLQESYLGDVNMIYIDPPYNTGNDFVYKDDYSDSVPEYLRKSNQVNEDGDRLVANTEANGRFHSDWLSMLYPRLKLARNMLSEDGVIFLSIDDGEQANLRKICDEIFGEKNFVANIIWQKKYAASNDAKYLSDVHDFVLCYCRDKEKWKPNLFPRSEELNSKYKNPDNDPRGPWYSTNLSVKTYSEKNDYVITSPAGIDHRPPPSRCWVVSKEKYEEYLADNRIWFGRDGKARPYQKKFFSEVQQGVVPTTLWLHEDAGHNIGAKSQVRDLFSDTAALFDTPKPTKLIDRLMALALPESEDCIVLDFFAGSCATAHAVLERNAATGAANRFVMVQLPEVNAPDTQAFVAGYKTIADMSKERIRRSGKVVLEGDCHEQWNKDVGFRVLEVDSSNMTDVYYIPDEVAQAGLLDNINNVKSERSPEDLLFQVLVDWGLDLSLPVGQQEVRGKTVFFINEEPYDLIACFDAGVTEELVQELARYEPLRVVFSDSGFESDAVKINVEQIFKQLSPGTEVRSI